ncbi:RNA-binding KH domain-containing protein RCF3 isoform X1 [Rosa chinensis]|uniref:RNA-binding KH domain-containing protein RCF3 isoform X1 n=1 Tax=Rosa chinensis TaxID=74649 RepID=UPI000D092EB2|nr:RNA-binding KH domain-containing protein RCF3 isoform X1 [Rosa chinensis]XP_024172677.1 RNA-binding KH domain-containing protein RCF3 isoform X1 [Rosa chinensis]
MSAPLTPSKRPHQEDPSEPNGKGKLQKSDDDQPTNTSSGNAVFRVVCPESKIGCVTGEGGSGISEIYQETLVKVRVEESVPGCDERVIVIGWDGENRVDSEQSKENGVEETSVVEKKEEKEDVSIDDSERREKVSPASVKKALQLVFERMVEGERETDGGDGDGKKSLTIVLRLLVLSNQIGCILGIGGSVIKLMASESGAQIRILPRDKLPLCAPASDELVQITGEVDAVRKALDSVTQQLLDNLPRASASSLLNSTGPSSQPSPRPEVTPPPERSQGTPYSNQAADIVDNHSAAHPLIPKVHASGIPGRMKSSQEVLTFRLLCHEERVGGVIGKGGTIIRTLKQETGCEIKVMDGVSDSEDRVIILSGPAHPDDRISPLQDAVLRVHDRIVRAVPITKEQPMTARLLISSNQIGCLLGKGGAIIAEMRKSSRAHIRILGKDQIPKCVSDDEEVVQMNGELEAVNDALLQITSRLQHHFFRDVFPSLSYPPNPAFSDQPPFRSYLRRDFSPPRMHSNFGPSFHKFDTVGGMAPHGGFHPLHLSERKPWGSQGLLEGGGPIGLPNFAGAPQRRIPGFGGSQPAIITSTTIEAVVPSSLIPIINGEDGECLKQIRQISDAKITITEPLPGAKETLIIISGTPEQTHAAQSLIQAFVMSETDSS